MNKSWGSAFSLVELMVVVAIIAILASIAVPTYKTYVTKARILEIVSIIRYNQNYINEYIAKNGKVPPASNFTPSGTSPYGTYKWEGQFGLSFWFNTVLHTPSPSGYLDIIYFRPHPDNTNGITRWTCSVWGGSANSLTSYVPAACQQDDSSWEFPEG